MSVNGVLCDVARETLQAIAQEDGRYFIGIDAHRFIACDGDRRPRRFFL